MQPDAHIRCNRFTNVELTHACTAIPQAEGNQPLCRPRRATQHLKEQSDAPECNDDIGVRNFQAGPDASMQDIGDIGSDT